MATIESECDTKAKSGRGVRPCGAIHEYYWPACLLGHRARQGAVNERSRSPVPPPVRESFLAPPANGNLFPCKSPTTNPPMRRTSSPLGMTNTIAPNRPDFTQKFAAFCGELHLKPSKPQRTCAAKKYSSIQNIRLVETGQTQRLRPVPRRPQFVAPRFAIDQHPRRPQSGWPNHAPPRLELSRQILQQAERLRPLFAVDAAATEVEQHARRKRRVAAALHQRDEPRQRRDRRPRILRPHPDEPLRRHRKSPVPQNVVAIRQRIRVGQQSVQRIVGGFDRHRGGSFERVTNCAAAFRRGVPPVGLSASALGEARKTTIMRHDACRTVVSLRDYGAARLAMRDPRLPDRKLQDTHEAPTRTEAFEKTNWGIPPDHAPQDRNRATIPMDVVST